MKWQRLLRRFEYKPLFQSTKKDHRNERLKKKVEDTLSETVTEFWKTEK